MKKILAIIIAITSVFCSTLISGCGKEIEPENNKVMLANFEQWGPDFQLIRPEKHFGAIKVNTDKQYVKSGNRSAKIQPMGNKAVGGQAIFTIPLSSELFNYDYTDFRYIESISFWFYNTEEETAEVEIGLKSSSMSKFGDYHFENGWTNVMIYPDYELLSFSLDLSSIQSLYMSFGNAGTSFRDELPVYYIDDIELTLSKEPINLKPIELDANEIVNFEKEYQNFVFSVDKTASSEYYYPDLEVVTASEYGITASQGEKVLRIQTYHAEKDGDNQWPSIYLSAICMRTALSRIPTNEWKDYEMLYDVYCENGTTEGSMENNFYSFDGAGCRVDAFTVVGGQRLKQKWYTIKIPMSFFVSKAPQLNPGKFYWRWFSYGGDTDLTYYIDNFRYQKVSE